MTPAPGSRGVIFFNRGTKCLVRLSVALYSLRKVYGGPVMVFYEGDLPDCFTGVLIKFDAGWHPIPPSPAPLVQKTRLWKFSPFDTSLFIDADTLVLEDPSPLFAEIEKTGFAVTRFSDWITTGKKIGGRIRSWRTIIGDDEVSKALAYGPAVNTGVFGFNRGHPLLPEWDRITTAGHGVPDIMARTLDESACQVLCHRFDVTLIDQRWNYSVNYGKGDTPGIVHFHGGKHVMPDNPLCEKWADHYWQARKQFPALAEPQGDKRLADYLYHGSKKYRTLPVMKRRPDLTVVTAADPKYAPRLTRNFKRWMEVPGLAEQRYLVFGINMEGKESAYSELADYPNVRVLPWRFEAPTIREVAFSAFVFGVARHVVTPYWMKLDADAEPTDRGRFEWPDYTKATITADPWHFTKVKGDPDAKRHWLNTLDLWWVEKFPQEGFIFPNIEGRTYKHPRIRSYCHIEQTDFTRRLARLCGERLPVPSHDTTAWYVAARTTEKIVRHKFRKWIVA